MAIYRTTPEKSNTTTTSPSAANDISEGYEVGSRWTNTSTRQVYVCQSNALGAAIWALDSDLTSELQAVYAAAADRITNTAAATFQAFANKKAIPANTLNAGDVVKIRGKTLMVARNAADDHDVALYLGTVAAGTKLVSTGDKSLVAGDYVMFEGAITISIAGAAGECHVDVLTKMMVGGVPSEVRTVLFDQALPTDIARDVTLAVDPTAQSAGNQIDQRELEAWVERAGTVA